MLWYRGPCLLDALDALTPPKQSINIPLRLPIHDVYKIEGVGTVAVGRVETGSLKVGCSCTIGPADLTTTISSIEMHHKEVDEALPGDYVGFKVENKGVKRGYVASESKRDPAKNTTMFVGQVIVINHPGKIVNGYTPVLDCHTAHIACRFDKIRAKIDKRTEEVIEEEPKFIKAGEAALVELIP